MSRMPGVLQRSAVILLLYLSPFAVAVAGPVDGSWSLAGPPGARFGHASAYDPVRDRIVFFGGTNSFSGAGAVNAQLLSLDLSGTDPAWTALIAAGSPPPARYAHTMIYDPVRDRMLVFGGYTNSIFLQDVWELSLVGTPTWTPLAPSGTKPAVRWGHGAAYDPVGDRMIVFGGGGNAGALYNDVWSLSLSGSPAWTLLTPSGTPPLTRRAASLVYDSNHQRLVMFGGFRVGTYLSDVWTLPLTGSLAWTPVVAGGSGPTGRAFHSATYDAGRDEMVVFAGSDGGLKNDAFALSFTGPATWTPITTPGDGPGVRSWHTLVRDPVRDRDIAFSGVSSIVLADLWRLDRAGTPAWTPIAASNPYILEARNGAAMIRDPVRDRLILFGGTGTTTLGDLWEWPLAAGQWARPLVAAGTPPSPRARASAIYDPVRDRMILYGGVTPGPVVVGEVWELTLSGTPTWTQLSPVGGPPVVRQAHSAVYDPVTDAMVVFGGLNLVNHQNDVWRLSLAAPMTWTDITPTAPGDKPGTRYGHFAALDPVQHRMYVFGGDPPDAQTWRLELNGTPVWSVEPTSGPSSRHYMSAIYDAARHRGVMFGGNNGATYLNEAWALNFSAGGAAWSALTPDGPLPPARFMAAAAYDVMRNRMLIFGGRNGILATDYNDLQSLQWEGALGVDPTPAPSPLALAPPWPNPSSGGVAIPFAMPSAGHARVRLYDVHGRFVRELLNGVVPAGPRELRWDRRTSAGDLSRAGVYFVELQAAGERRTQRIVATD